MQKELLKNEDFEMLEFAIRGAKLGLWDWNISTGKLNHNYRWAEMLGYSSTDSYPCLKSWETLVHPEDKDEVLLKLNEHLQGYSDVYKSEHRLQTKDGGWVWVYDSGMVVKKDEYGKPIRMSGVHCDITTQKNAEEKLQQAMLQSEEMNRLKDVFLKNISHEFRTPLIGILGFSELLLEETDDPDHREMLRGINSSAIELNTKLEHVINLLKIENKEYSVKSEEVNILELVENELSIYRTKSLEKNLYVDLIAIVHNQYIHSDISLLKTVLNNLIDNAIKFTDEGGIKITLDSIFEDNKNFSVIKIKDSGVGIPPDQIDIVFGEFRQADERLNKRYNGTGLGLSIAHKIICLLDGKIEIRSEVGLGTEFIVKLPSVI